MATRSENSLIFLGSKRGKVTRRRGVGGLRGNEHTMMEDGRWDNEK